MKGRERPTCATCSVKDPICSVEGGRGPKNCPMKNYSDTIEKVLKEYEKPEIREFARIASIQEAECYSNRHIQPFVRHPVKPRVQEVCEFAKKMGYRKLGIAFCSGLRSEARALSRILEAQGFEVVSVSCHVGRASKEVIGIREEEKIRIGQFEAMCSPIVQATILNEENTDFNILVGLCVGHDSLFFKYARGPTTVLVVKDRVLGHNPVAALYNVEGYYSRMLLPGIDRKSTPG